MFSIPMLIAACIESQTLLNTPGSPSSFPSKLGNQFSKTVVIASNELLNPSCKPSIKPSVILNRFSHTPSQSPSKASANKSNISAIAVKADSNIVVTFSKAVVNIVCIPPESLSQAPFIPTHKSLAFSFIELNILPTSSNIFSQASLNPAKLVFHATTAATITPVAIPIGPVNNPIAEPKPPIADAAVPTPLLNKPNPFTIPPIPVISLPPIDKTGPIAAATNPKLTIEL